MTLLPIVQRELYVASRRRVTYWGRLVAALVALGIVGFGVWIEDSVFLVGGLPMSAGASVGAMIFRTLSYVAFFGCLFAGILLTADSISSERRQDTLGLLFLTDLRGYDVVLGKLACHSMRALYCLLAILPMVALPLLLGGVDVWGLIRVSAVLLNTLLLALSAGILASSFCREYQNALCLAEGFGLVLAGAGPLIDEILRSRSEGGNGLEVFGCTSPVWLLERALSWNSMGAMPVSFLGPLALQTSMALSFLALASWRLPTCWQVKPGRRTLAGLRECWSRLKYGGPERRADRRRVLLEQNPLCWLGSRDRLSGPVLWSLAVLLVGIGLMMNLTGSPWGQLEAIGSLFMIHGVLKVIVAADAANRCVELRRDGMLCAIWSTRLSARDLVDGLLLGMRRVFRGPIVLALAYNLVWLVMSIREAPGERRWLSAFEGLCVAPFLLWDVYVLARLGLWHGLRVRNPHNGAYLAVFKVLVLPWVGILLLGMWGGFSSRPLLYGWPLFGAAVNLFFSFSNDVGLNQEFHRLVQDRVKGVKTSYWSSDRNVATMGR